MLIQTDAGAGLRRIERPPTTERRWVTTRPDAAATSGERVKMESRKPRGGGPRSCSSADGRFALANWPDLHPNAYATRQGAQRHRAVKDITNEAHIKIVTASAALKRGRQARHHMDVSAGRSGLVHSDKRRSPRRGSNVRRRHRQSRNVGRDKVGSESVRTISAVTDVLIGRRMSPDFPLKTTDRLAPEQ